MPTTFFDSATVKGALVSGLISVVAVLVAVWLPSKLDAPQLKEDKAKLEKEITDKNHQIQELQTLLVPFKTVAFQTFTGTEAERLSKLALKLNDIQKGLEVLSSDQAAIKAKTDQIAGEVQNRLPPPQRHLSPEQRTALIESLKAAVKREIAIRHPLNIECQTFAIEIKSAIIEAGWTVREPQFLGIPQTDGEGLAIILKDENNIPDGAVDFAKALIAIKIVPMPMKMAPIGGMKEGTFDLYVGHVLK